MTSVISHINVQYSKTIGRGEQFGPGFNYPVFVARGKEGVMYVLCRGSEFRPEGVRVTVCTTDEEYISTFARGVNFQGPHEFNTDDGSLVWPTCIALDSQENLFISDEWLNRISSFSKDGDYLGKWEEKSGTGDGELDRPSGMVFDADDNLYIVDSGNHRVQKFSKDGKFLMKFGSEGSGDGEFNMPWGIAIDDDGDLYIADWRNDRIQKFSPDGKFLMKFGSSGSGEGQFDRPTGVAVDRDGVIYVADWLNNRMQVFDQEGNFVVAKTGDAGISKWGMDKLDANAEMWGERDRAQGLEREKDFWGPTGVTVDDEGNIFVPESARNRIQVYKTQSPTFAGPRL
ncbi:MAG: NHL repeat-containing protein [Chloroflexi bacterium]|nr:NHL repeat-containing protein [Chloroflexota bacterium]MCH8802107.1 NHL repeat-containing protein [Chloroflexota bacterium]MCH8893184.1 NHL repeat-containing protein [Chloroflexota bacterium]MCI0789321.1 NHL repeat-containing protein [Chloroflexota bacterium]MCI0800994.1 NHL repeat-containing protein [Chloroflexota bacterium]